MSCRSSILRLLGSTLVLAPLLACAPDPPVTLAIGGPVPDVAFATIDGGTVESRSLVGRPTVLSFWATWCRPCVHEIPVLQQLHDEGQVHVLAVALDDDRAKVAPFMTAQGIAYPVALGDQAAFRRFDGSTIPYTVVLDAGGTVAAIHRGTVTLATLRAALEPLRSTS